MSDEEEFKFYKKVLLSCETVEQLSSFCSWFDRVEELTKPSLYWAYVMGVRDTLADKLINSSECTASNK